MVSLNHLTVNSVDQILSDVLDRYDASLDKQELLAALNRIYYRSSEHKWMASLISEMDIVPHDLLARMKQILSADLATDERQVKELISEIIALVEIHMPDVDQPFPGDAHAQVNLEWVRRRWEPGTPYSLMGSIGASISKR